MEKDGLFGDFNWHPDSHGISAVAEMNDNSNNNNSNNCGSCDNRNGADRSCVLAATSSFLNLNWDQSSTDQTANFESALSSLVSSPSSSNPNPNLPAASADSLVIRELIGRLGSICSSSSSSNNNNNSSSDVSPPNSFHYQRTNNSCYSTPLNSPPKLNLLSMMDHHPQFKLSRAAVAGDGSSGSNNNNSHHPILTADPDFAERAARFSSFGASAAAKNYAQFGLQEPGKLSRVSSSQSLKGMAAANNGVGVNVKHPDPMHLLQQQPQPQQLHVMGNGLGGQLENDMVLMMLMRSGGEFSSNSAQEESSASDRMAPNVNMNGNEGNVLKRKATTPSTNKGSSSNSGGGRGKEQANLNPNPPTGSREENSNPKRSKSAAAEAEADADGAGKDPALKSPKPEQNSTSTESARKQDKDKDKDKDENKDKDVKPSEPPKQDYIHVRARRGQATDSHSLAERARREKISERMKFLQDLVPGCSKVTGKAVMLDEIINYVQSLQRQVEFLSMKLATVNPPLDKNVDNLLMKDVHQPHGPMMAQHSPYPLEAMSNGFSSVNQPKGHNPIQSFITSNGLETQCLVSDPLDASSILRRSLGMQLPSHEGFADAAVSQLGTFWEDDLQSVVQMGFGQNQVAISSSHNFQGPLTTSHMKTEL